MRADCWTHNVAYHPWLLRRVNPGRVLDVGCGDGLLVQRLAAQCRRVVGLEPHEPTARRARARLAGVKNAEIAAVPFEAYPAAPGSFETVIFAASLHHINLETALERAKALLAPGGRLLIVGCARPAGPWDLVIEALRVIPARLGSRLHGECRDIGVPVCPPAHSLRQIRCLAKRCLPGAAIRRGLYYRYLLSWTKGLEGD